MGLADEDRSGLWIQNGHEVMEEGGLAGSHLSGDRHEPLPLVDPVDQRSYGFLMTLGHKEKIRIRGQIEGLYRKTIEAAIHNCSKKRIEHSAWRKA